MPARGEITVNGFDLGELGFVLQNDADGWRDGVALGALELAPVPGSAGVAVLGRTTSARSIGVSGAMRADTMAELLASTDELKARLSDGVLEVAFGDDAARVFFCELDGPVRIAPERPVITQPMHWLRFTLLCPVGYVFDASPTIVDFSAAAAECPLGTGAVAPLLRLIGPATNPVVTYRDARGDEIATLGMTAELAAGDVREIDCGRFRIVDGGGVNRIGELTSGDFLAMDPRDALGEDGPYPTLEVSGLTGNALVMYRRSWL